MALEGGRDDLRDVVDETILGNLMPVGVLHGTLVGAGVIGAAGAVGTLFAGGGIILLVAANERELGLGGAALIAYEEGASAVGDENPGAVLQGIQRHGWALA